jgi:hypothetical protein
MGIVLLRHEASLGVPAADALAAHVADGFRRAAGPGVAIAA